MGMTELMTIQSWYKFKSCCSLLADVIVGLSCCNFALHIHFDPSAALPRVRPRGQVGYTWKSVKKGNRFFYVKILYDFIMC